MADRTIDDCLIQGSIAAIGREFRARRLSVRETVAWYLARIERFDRNGPALNAVRTLNPHALDAASRADDELARGIDRGPLHGIPVLLKDNILTGDGMPASAGAAALADFLPKHDATLVTRLRQAGAIVLGKTNMTEFADYVSDVMPSGFSGAGGVVRNPHGIEYGRGQGSSVGSAAAVAAGFAPIAIGSETQNSIQTPACYSSVVGFKPGVGAVSRAGVIPLVPSQDSPGPLTRSVADAVLVFAALAGADLHDTCTLGYAIAPAGAPPASLAGVRIGVPRRCVADRLDMAAVLPLFDTLLSRLAGAGAVIVDPCDLPSAEQLQEVRSSVFRTEFKAALNVFLEAQGAPGDIANLSDLIAWNDRHSELIPYGQSLLLAAEQTKGLDDPGYVSDRRRDIALSRTAGIDAALAMSGADVLMSPMGSAAKCTGKAGAPAIALPFGLDASGTPFGVVLYTSLGNDARLLQIAAAVEQVAGDRHLPKL